LDFELLDKAKERVPSAPVLINMVSKRVQQLNSGFRPMVKRIGREEENMDLALREIADGKLIAEIDFSSQALQDIKK
jgi:DNA-directed RNA polymerase subunit K/omega